MRTLIELYKIILNEFETSYSSYWICNTIKYSNNLDYTEKDRLLEHFKSQKPSENKYQEFYNSPYFFKRGSEWWSRKNNTSRIEFLKEIIKNLEKEFAESNF